jgi:hypothetical protein
MSYDEYLKMFNLDLNTLDDEKILNCAARGLLLLLK